jgi:phage terminase Nu1 subunit (DNA packaging protein)
VLISVPEAALVLGLKGRTSIYRKIESKELPIVLDESGKPMIERNGLEELWGRITRKKASSSKPPRSAPVDASEVPDYNDERARHEQEKRLLAELKRQELERDLLRRDDVTTAWTQAVNITRTRLLGVPSTAKQRIPHLEVEEVELLTTLIREALDELAAGEVKV